MNDIESASSGTDAKTELTPLETVEVCSAEDPSASVIWLHGLGADGHDFEPAIPHLLWQGAPAIRFVFPHAEVRPVTINGGMKMRAWYDILGFDSERDHDAAGIEKSVQQVTQLVKREQRRGVASEKIILAGFSQGGAIAIQVALRFPQRLAGLIAVSTYLLRADRIGAEASAVNSSLPVFMAHGSNDPVVPIHLGQAAAQKCRELGCSVEWHDYSIEHSVSLEEMHHISVWLRQRISQVNG